MSRILIVEDDPIIAADLRMIVQKLGYSCEQTDNAAEAERLISENSFDLFMLDISITGGKDGVELAGSIRSSQSAPIIFLTSYFDTQTLDRVRVINPEAFIVKPFEERNLVVNIELALFKSKTRQPERPPAPDRQKLFVKHGGELKALHLDEILYLEAEDNYSYVHTAGAKYMLSYTLKNLEEKVNSRDFIRIHRSYIVNLNKVTSIQEGYVMPDKIKLPLSRTYRADFLRTLKVL